MNYFNGLDSDLDKFYCELQFNKIKTPKSAKSTKKALRSAAFAE